MRRNGWWKLGALVFALAAPTANVLLTLARAAGTGPFMVERGHQDGVAPDEWVAYEFAKVRRFYASRMKLADKTEIEFFDGPHTINGRATFDFLKRHLKWPD